MAITKKPTKVTNVAEGVEKSEPSYSVGWDVNCYSCYGEQCGCSLKTLRSEVKSLSRVRLCATPWTAAYQAPPSMGFSRQEYWSGLPFPSPGDLPDPGMKPGSAAWRKDCSLSELLGNPFPRKPQSQCI